jgi:hypothetical protein
MPNKAEDIRQRVNIVQIIERYTPLVKRGGTEWRGKEHPSLAVDEAKQLYFWHSHNEGGDVFQWVANREGCEFKRALEIVAEFAGTTITPLPRPIAEPAKPLPALGKVEQFERNLIDCAGAVDYWQREGFEYEECLVWRFGFTPELWNMGAALVIPNFYRGELMSVKYRLLARDKDKYRSEGASHLFNRDALDVERDVFLVEGEKKAAYLTNRGLVAVGLPGVGIFKDEWLPAFAGKRVTLALDDGINPYSLEYPRQIAHVADELRLMFLTVKPDDYFFRYGGSVEQFREMQQSARRWRKAKVAK